MNFPRAHQPCLMGVKIPVNLNVLVQELREVVNAMRPQFLPLGFVNAFIEVSQSGHELNTQLRRLSRPSEAPAMAVAGA